LLDIKGGLGMGKVDRISGIFWLCFAVLMIIQSYRLGLGSLHKPGPGFLFFWVNIALGIMSLVVLIRAWAGKKEEGPQSAIFGRQNVSKIIFVLISLFLYALLMETVGFIPVTLLLFIFLLGIVEKKRWYYTVFVSIVVTVISYLIFETWLQSQLPRGLLEFLRF
jgi:putative tricarboxylic transport membrane protein